MTQQMLVSHCTLYDVICTRFTERDTNKKMGLKFIMFNEQMKKDFENFAKWIKLKDNRFSRIKDFLIVEVIVNIRLI